MTDLKFKLRFIKKLGVNQRILLNSMITNDTRVYIRRKLYTIHQKRMEVRTPNGRIIELFINSASNNNQLMLSLYQRKFIKLEKSTEEFDIYKIDEDFKNKINES